MNAVVKSQPQELATVAPTMQQQAMLRMIETAATSDDFDVEKLKELLAMKKEWEADEARKAFNLAFANFKAEAIKVYKGTEIKDGPLKGKRHANLFDVVVASVEALARNGLSTSWNLTKDEPQLMEVTCKLRHSAGHFETVSMQAAPDTGPGRNAIQARGSAKSYLERYTLMAILGLAATERDDNDGGAGAEPEKTEADLEAERKAEATKREWIDAFDGAHDQPALTKLYSDLCTACGGRDMVPAQLKTAYISRKKAIG